MASTRQRYVSTFIYFIDTVRPAFCCLRHGVLGALLLYPHAIQIEGELTVVPDRQQVDHRIDMRVQQQVIVEDVLPQVSIPHPAAQALERNGRLQRPAPERVA